MRHGILFGVLVLIIGVGFSTVHARTITTFDNRIVWEAASVRPGTELLTVNFNSLAEQTFAVPDGAAPGSAPRVDVGPFFLQGFGTPTGLPLDLDIIDAPPLEAGGAFQINGSTYALMSVTFEESSDTSRIVIMGFDRPTTAFGADFKEAGTGAMVDLLLFPGDPSPARVPVTVNTGFFGFVSDSPIELMHFTARTEGSESEIFGLDNVSIRALPEGGAHSRSSCLEAPWCFQSSGGAGPASSPEEVRDAESNPV